MATPPARFTPYGWPEPDDPKAVLLAATARAVGIPSATA